MYSDITNQLRSIQQTLNSKSEDVWMTLKDVCTYTKLSSSTLHRASQRGELKVSKKTGKNLFRKEWVDRFLGE